MSVFDTVDVICHGVPSARSCLIDYSYKIEKQKKRSADKSVKNYVFRDKEKRLGDEWSNYSLAKGRMELKR